KDGQPQFILRGVSVMGVPLPNAWLGEVKHRDLASEFGEGFWQDLARGIKDIEVRDGRLRVLLRP
ncbi:MAG: arginine N-succinyltransferase, partial [Gammaproteobacteria bacterium]